MRLFLWLVGFSLMAALSFPWLNHAWPVHRDRGALACEDPAMRQFDFWVGTWSLTWGENGTGTNTVRRILGGCVIEESFEGQMPDGLYRGRSLSVYDPDADRWRQTWVDDRGGYLDFVGAYKDSTMILRRTTTNENGATVHQRMVWYNIEENSLDWNWEKSDDGGETWTTRWAIHYERETRGMAKGE